MMDSVFFFFSDVKVQTHLLSASIGVGYEYRLWNSDDFYCMIALPT